MNPIQRQQAAQSSVHSQYSPSQTFHSLLHFEIRVQRLIPSYPNKRKSSNASMENFLPKRTSWAKNSKFATSFNIANMRRIENTLIQEIICFPKQERHLTTRSAERHPTSAPKYPLQKVFLIPQMLMLLRGIKA